MEIEMKTRFLGAAAVVTASALLLTGCGGGSADDAAAEVDFGAEPTGTLKAWGFENADDVGTSRMDHAAEVLPDVEVDLDAVVNFCASPAATCPTWCRWTAATRPPMPRRGW
jgi:ABC-type glycerol-3-phosphate transport system substrate-binding protein